MHSERCRERERISIQRARRRRRRLLYVTTLTPAEQRRFLFAEIEGEQNTQQSIGAGANRETKGWSRGNKAIESRRKSARVHFSSARSRSRTRKINLPKLAVHVAQCAHEHPTTPTMRRQMHVFIYAGHLIPRVRTEKRRGREKRMHFR